MAIESLLTTPPTTPPAPGQLVGTVSKAPATLSDPMQAKVPSFDPTGPFIYEIPAGRWMPRQGNRPAVGDACLIVIDENGEAWVAAWEPAEGKEAAGEGKEGPPGPEGPKGATGATGPEGPEGKGDVSEMVGCVVNGSSKTKARPAGFPCVVWIGTVTPEHALENDLVVNLTEATISVVT